MAIFLRLFLFFMAFTVVPMQTYLRKSREARERQAREIQVIEGSTGGQETRQKNPSYFMDIRNSNRPEVIGVELRDESSVGDLGEARVSDIYKKEYMASGVVGLVGVPVRITYQEGAAPRLTFYYDEDELRGIPERNLIILHEDADGSYVQVGQESKDEEENTISVAISEPGIYLMADCYQWYTVWGVDMSDYAYGVDPTMYPSAWERECDTGSILELADKKWAMENAPVFHVSTASELASVVYYNNAIMDYGAYGGELYVYLEDDIDLAGYRWVPMGWTGATNNRFDGVFDGQGHTISNLTMDPSNESHVAFIGYSTGVVVKNVTFKDATVIGGSYTGIVGGEIYISREWENVHVSGVIADARGEVGSIVGREAYLHFKDCSADVVLSNPTGGADQQLEYFSHRLEVVANTPATEDFQLTYEEDGSITRTTSEEYFQNLCWHLDADGVLVLQRSADHEENLDPSEFFDNYLRAGHKCEIWLEAYTGETYTRVSNILEYPKK